MLKNIILYCSLALSVVTNIFLATVVLQRLPAAPPSVVVAQPAPVPTIQAPKAAPPIHVLVPMPKPKPVAEVEQRKPKVKKHRKHKRHVAHKKPQVSVTVTEPTKSVPKVKKAKVKAEKSVDFNCSQLPSWITAISPATIRSEGSARGYSSATLEKVISCRAKMGGSG